MRPLFVLFTATLVTLAIGATPREVYYQGPLTPLNTTPTFDKGYLFVYDAHQINVFGPDGSLLCGISAQVANAKVVNILNAAADADGTVAGAVVYSMDGTSKAEGGGIAVFDRSGSQVRFFDTGRYFPTQVSFGPDHSIWTLGWPGSQVRRWSDDFFVLRNYSQQGRELGKFLPRSSFDPEPDPVGPMVGMWELRVIGDRVGAIIYRSSIYKESQTRPAMVWIETDLEGKVLERWDVGMDPAPGAFTQSGALYTHEGSSVSVFDRTTKVWRKVAPADGILLGADGDSLVFHIRGTNTLRWVPASQ